MQYDVILITNLHELSYVLTLDPTPSNKALASRPKEFHTYYVTSGSGCAAILCIQKIGIMHIPFSRQSRVSKTCPLQQLQENGVKVVWKTKNYLWGTLLLPMKLYCITTKCLKELHYDRAIQQSNPSL